MKIYKITEASKYLGVSINTLKTLANNDTITDDDLRDAYLQVMHDIRERKGKDYVCALDTRALNYL